SSCRCRVCLRNSKEMVNIFDNALEKGVPMADLLSHSTGLEIFKGDSYPETVCPPCLEDAMKALETKRTFTSKEFKQNPAATMSDLTEEESGIQVKNEVIDNLLEELPPQMEYFQIDEFLSDEVKHEPIEEFISNNEMNEKPTEEEYFQEQVITEDPTEEFDQVQVINEPIEDDSLEDDFGAGLDYEIDPSYLREQSEVTNDDNDNRPIFLTPKVDHNSLSFQCSSCPRLFPTRCQLKLHEHRHKKPTYKCPHCEMAFLYQSLLEKHIRKHTGERPFKCLVCQQDFETQQQYTIHFKSHQNIPLFKCSHCVLAFSSTEELEEHVKTHTKEPSYNCSVKSCQREFQNKNALINHIAFNHDLKKSIFKCS
ncbi:hypothetical protein KR054_003323, partial [Drosophila jambulina]